MARTPNEEEFRQWLKDAQKEYDELDRNYGGTEGEYDKWCLNQAEDLLGVATGLRTLLDAERTRIAEMEASADQSDELEAELRTDVLALKHELDAARERIADLEDVELELRGKVSEYRQAVLAHLSNTGYAGEPSSTRLELMRVAGVRS